MISSAKKNGRHPTPVAHEDRRMPDPWRDDVDSTLRFLRSGFSKHDAELKKQTKMLGTVISSQQQTHKKLDELATELGPVVTGVKASRWAGRKATWLTNMGAKVAKIGIFTGAGLAFALALTHGETWKQAIAAFWRVVSGGE